ncbi:hypothetical protein BC332_03466 [Capsicum chinense]|nr:hypothetical protein BC332_03466 [Capsicum chinense]
MGTTRAVMVIAMTTLLLASIICEGKRIDYGAIVRDHIECSRRGKSIKNCHLGRPTNTYRRGCEAINRCRNGSRAPYAAQRLKTPTIPTGIVQH